MKPGYVFEAPYAPTSENGADSVCTGCGAIAKSNKQISQYPHKYIPSGWMVAGVSRAMLCDQCFRNGVEPANHGTFNDWYDGKIAKIREEKAPPVYLSAAQLGSVVRLLASVLAIRRGENQFLGMTSLYHEACDALWLICKEEPVSAKDVIATIDAALKWLGGPLASSMFPQANEDEQSAVLRLLKHLVTLAEAHGHHHVSVGELHIRYNEPAAPSPWTIPQLPPSDRQMELAKNVAKDVAKRIQKRRQERSAMGDSDSKMYADLADMAAHAAEHQVKPHAQQGEARDLRRAIHQRLDHLLEDTLSFRSEHLGDRSQDYQDLAAMLDGFMSANTEEAARKACYMLRELARIAREQAAIMLLHRSSRYHDIDAYGFMDIPTVEAHVKDVSDELNAMNALAQQTIEVDATIRRLNMITGRFQSHGDVSEPVPGAIATSHLRRENKMSETLKKQGRDITDAVGLGLKLAAANEAGEIFVDLAKEMFADSPMVQVALQSPDGKELAKFLMAVLLQTGAEHTNLLPHSDAIATVCKLQMAASTKELVGPRMNKMRKHLMKLAKLGAAAGAMAEDAEGGREQIRARFEDDDVERELTELKEEMAEMKKQLAKAKSRAKEA